SAHPINRQCQSIQELRSEPLRLLSHRFLHSQLRRFARSSLTPSGDTRDQTRLIEWNRCSMGSQVHSHPH
ncbi:hypothetical protein PMAYCL1PPCAC_07584, partial [Pristionchus mayeri]